MTHNQTSGVIRIEKQGPPSVLQYTSTELGPLTGNYVLLSQKAIALNFVDVLFRNGSFSLPHLPATIGVEAAGVIEAVGPQVKNFIPGDRVGYYFNLGAYAEKRLINADSLIKLPGAVTFNQAAAVMAKGLTARMLVKQAYAVKAGDTVLVHAAAGGVGSLVSRWAKAIGATVIGTVGSTSKKPYALQHGIDHVIALDSEDLHTAVQKITMGKGIQVVYDGVGKATFNQSLNLLATGGSAILYGAASGESDINTTLLKNNQINLVRPSVSSYLPGSNAVALAAREVFDALQKGVFGNITPTLFALQDAAKAHQQLEAGKTTGSVIFHP